MNTAGQILGSSSPTGPSGAERAAAWLVADQLSCVLHVGDSPLAYVLADQGHEVVVAGDDVVRRRHPDVLYVRSVGERLPFRPDAFDVVVAPELRDSPVALADYARVLRPDGLLSTLTRTHDRSIPWMRKLREIVGEPPHPRDPADTFGASGLFTDPESTEIGAWEQLDLPGLLRFAEELGGTPGAPLDPAQHAGAVRNLFGEYAAHTGTLRVRHQTTCTRARVVKEAGEEPEQQPDTFLLDFR